jgi:hypothetical protein
MRKKIILVTFCLILFLIFTALGYAWGPKAERIRGDPWEHLKSPKIDDNQNLDFVLLIINPDFYLIFTFQSKVESFRNSDSLIKYDSLNKNETKRKK